MNESMFNLKLKSYRNMIVGLYTSCKHITVDDPTYQVRQITRTSGNNLMVIRVPGRTDLGDAIFEANVTTSDTNVKTDHLEIDRFIYDSDTYVVYNVTVTRL